MKAKSIATVRISVTFQKDIYETLERIAKEKRVSTAWVVRDATEQYVGDNWPLFKARGP